MDEKSTVPGKMGSSTGEKNAPAAKNVGDAPQPAELVEEFPDPDEDDLDDLDDMLDDFSAVKLSTSAKPRSADGQEASPPPIGQSTTRDKSEPGSTTVAEDLDGEEIQKQMQDGISGLLNEIESSPELKQQFEEMFKQMATEANGGEPPSTPPLAGDASFQDTIRKTMTRMQESGEQATAAAAAGGEDDFMSELLKQMSSGDLTGEGGEEEFSKMLMGMMEQLTNKEILYEPMKELDEKFPEWMEKNKDSTPADDLERYEEQRSLVREIVAKFEESSYSDSNAADREYIVDRMQKMQAAGSPPTDLVGDMASAQEAFNATDDQCNPQ